MKTFLESVSPDIAFEVDVLETRHYQYISKGIETTLPVVKHPNIVSCINYIS